VTTILVVDDEVAITDLLQSLLEDAGYQVVTAINGREALAVLGRQRLDLVLCDMMMPVLDGAGLCRAMQADVAYRTIPLVLMSAVRQKLLIADCAYAAVVAKPFDVDLLLATVAGVVGVPKPASGDSRGASE